MTISLMPAPVDRVPSMVLENGAVRWAVYDEAGQFLRYEYHLRADAPTEEGSRVNKMLLEAPGKVIFDNFSNKSLWRYPGTYNLSVGSNDIGGVKTGDYALFGRGTIDVINNALIQVTTVALSVARGSMANAAIGDYGLFAGGGSTSSTWTNVVDAFNSELVRVTAPVLSVARGMLTGVTVGDYALICGGASGSSTYSGRTNVDAINANLVITTATALAHGGYMGASTKIGDYGVIAGGTTSSGTNSPATDGVSAYNPQLVRTTPTVLSAARSHISAASTANHGIFAGGRLSGGSALTGIVDTYTTNLVKGTATSINASRGQIGVSFDGYAFLLNSPTVSIFSPSLSLSSVNIGTSISADGRAGAVALEPFAIFGADGIFAPFVISGVEITIPPRSAYRFDTYQEEEIYTFEEQALDFIGSITGYYRQAGIIASGYEPSIT